LASLEYRFVYSRLVYSFALEKSEEIGCRYIILETRENKVDFYGKCGFQRGASLDGDKFVWMYKKIAFE
jgi:hypothetical protein